MGPFFTVDHTHFKDLESEHAIFTGNDLDVSLLLVACDPSQMYRMSGGKKIGTVNNSLRNTWKHVCIPRTFYDKVGLCPHILFPHAVSSLIEFFQRNRREKLFRRQALGQFCHDDFSPVWDGFHPLHLHEGPWLLYDWPSKRQSLTHFFYWLCNLLLVIRNVSHGYQAPRRLSHSVSNL